MSPCPSEDLPATFDYESELFRKAIPTYLSKLASQLDCYTQQAENAIDLKPDAFSEIVPEYTAAEKEELLKNIVIRTTKLATLLCPDAMTRADGKEPRGELGADKLQEWVMAGFEEGKEVYDRGKGVSTQ